jgi:predicted Zn-dependent protease
MQQDSVTFWTEIKNYEEQLTKSPDSFCFAKLSEIYLAVGLVDDALQTARQGVLRHPDYLAGQRSLALACRAKGLQAECLQALQRVTAALPEDASSQKLLARLHSENGDRVAAVEVYRVLSEFEPDDVECRMELAALEHVSSSSFELAESEWDDDEEIIEDLEIVEDDESDSDYQAAQAEAVAERLEPEAVVAVLPEAGYDPLSTVTVAELYVTQGYIQRALEIYRSILSDDPDNGQVRARIAALELQALVAVTTAEKGADSFEDDTDGDEDGENKKIKDDAGDVIEVPYATYRDETVPAGADVVDVAEPLVSEYSFLADSIVNAATMVPQQGSADVVVTELEMCLDNIRRIKACR